MIADQNATIGEAFNVFKLLEDNRFWSYVLVLFLAGLAASAGIILCGVGVLFTFPFALCVAVAAYDRMIGGNADVQPPSGELPPSDPFRPTPPPPSVP